MLLFDVLRDNPPFLWFATALLGLTVGSFLNVVILRLPRMMEMAWKRECREILELPAIEEKRLSLVFPSSRCNGCGAPIRAWQNVPVLSWLLLRGQCARCKTPISIQYPLVEAAAGAVSAVCAWHFGWSVQLLPALVLSWALLTLAVIDLRTQLLPDDITLPLLWLGLGLSMWSVFAGTQDALIGAMAGYLSLWTVFQLFRLITGKEGMGYGDFKLFAALGAWLGWQSLPLIILLSSVVGAVVGLGLVLLRRQGRDIPMAFGPYLAAAGWIALIWGHEITAAYLDNSGIH
ncbi:MAG: prepilin peptidase [Nevskiaceae bacterium]|nr:MAG: prepilin peptidase [Nevskiaceae bacterium]